MAHKELDYPASANGNFHIADSTFSPHPYMLGPKHIEYAANTYNGILTENALKEAHKSGITCAQKGCQLSLAEHQQILIIKCYVDIAAYKEDTDHPIMDELHDYLKQHVDQATAEGYAGFAFMDATTQQIH